MSFRLSTALAAVSLASLAAAQSSAIWFTGLEHRSLGQASLGISGGSLFVGNIGTTGQDGVRILTIDVESLRLEMPFDPALMPTGATRTFAVRGELDGGPQTDLQSLALLRTSAGLLLVPDYAGVGAARYTASVYDAGGGLLYQGTDLQAGVLELRPTQQIVLDTGATPWGGHVVVSPEDMVVATPAGLLAARRIVLEPENTTFTSLAVTEAQVRSIAESAFRVLGEWIGLFGDLPHTAAGDARLEPTSGGRLVVGNLSSSGEDGVRVALGQYDGWITLESVALGPIQPGASLRLESLGTIAATPGSPYASIEMTKTSDTVFPITADFSPVAASGVYIKYELMDVIIVSYSINASGAELARGTAPPTSYVMGASMTASWATPVQLRTPAGTVFTADSLTVTPVDPDESLERLDEVRVTGGGGLAEFVIDDERLVPLPAIGVTYCTPAVPHSGGVAARLAAYGSAVLLDREVWLRATDLPVNQFGYFLASETPGAFIPPGSSGRLCLSGTIGRYVQDLGSSGPAGVRALTVDVGAIPTFPVHAVAVGETWRFQLWFRDFGPTSNFTDAVRITFH